MCRAGCCAMSHQAAATTRHSRQQCNRQRTNVWMLLVLASTQMMMQSGVQAAASTCSAVPATCSLDPPPNSISVAALSAATAAAGTRVTSPLVTAPTSRQTPAASSGNLGQLLQAMGAPSSPNFAVFQQTPPPNGVLQRVMPRNTVSTTPATVDLFGQLLQLLLNGRPVVTTPQPPPPRQAPPPPPVRPPPSTWVPPRPPVGTPVPLPADQIPKRVSFMSNNRLTVGLDARRGGAIVHLSSYVMPSIWSGRNLLNDYDLGRLVQQSYYGCDDASCWYTRPWRWNPVQAGSWKSAPSALVQFQQLGDPVSRIFSRTMPRNWGGEQLLQDVLLDTDAQLMADHVRINFTMRYSGTAPHPIMTQEIPALFAHRRLGALVFYNGTTPWSNDTLSSVFPGGSNGYYSATEKWAAYVDPASGYGVGIYVPVSSGLTAYRVGPDGSNATSDCSYLALTTRFAIQPGAVFSYMGYLAIGRVDQMRATFARINAEIQAAGGIRRNAVNTGLVLGGGSIVPLAPNSAANTGNADALQPPGRSASAPPSSNSVNLYSVPVPPAPKAAPAPVASTRRPPPPPPKPASPAPKSATTPPPSNRGAVIAVQLLQFAGNVLVGLARSGANGSSPPSAPSSSAPRTG